MVCIYQTPTPQNRYHWRDTAFCEAFAEAVCGSEPGVIMDVGPGDGWPSLSIASRCKHVIGIDPSETRIKVQTGNAQRLDVSNCEFRNMDVQQLDFNSNSIDGVVAASSIEQAEDPIKGLTEIFRVLKPGARLAMIFEVYDDRVDNSSEELTADITELDCLLSYTVRQTGFCREAHYAVSVEINALEDYIIRQALHSISATRSEWLLDNDLIALLLSLRSKIRDSSYYELHHFTLRSLEEALEKIGYINVRGFSSDINGLMPFADFAIASGQASIFDNTFIDTSKAFGAASVRCATPGANHFTIATKP